MMAIRPSLLLLAVMHSEYIGSFHVVVLAWSMNHRQQRPQELSHKVVDTAAANASKRQRFQMVAEMPYRTALNEVHLCNPDPLGPPGPLLMLPIGVHHPPLLIQRSKDSSTCGTSSSSSRRSSRTDSAITVHRLSFNPPIFLLRNALAPKECQQIMEHASRNMSPAQTTEGDGTVLRRNCHVAWLNNTDMIRNVGRDMGNRLLSDEVKTSPHAGCEKLQVVHYFEPGGEFVLHHDGVGRVLTVIYYLNGVAGTWFPLADMEHSALPRDRDQALHIAKDFVPGQDGLLVAGRQSPLLNHARQENTVIVEAGDCVAFYNYQSNDETGDGPNWQSLHAGLPTTKQEGEKWIANHWMHAPALFQNVKTHFPAA